MSAALGRVLRRGGGGVVDGSGGSLRDERRCALAGRWRRDLRASWLTGTPGEGEQQNGCQNGGCTRGHDPGPIWVVALHQFPLVEALLVPLNIPQSDDSGEEGTMRHLLSLAACLIVTATT